MLQSSIVSLFMSTSYSRNSRIFINCYLLYMHHCYTKHGCIACCTLYSLKICTVWNSVTVRLCTTSYPIVSHPHLSPFLFFLPSFIHTYIYIYIYNSIHIHNFSPLMHLMHCCQADDSPSRRIIGTLPSAYPARQMFYTP